MKSYVLLAKSRATLILTCQGLLATSLFVIIFVLYFKRKEQTGFHKSSLCCLSTSNSQVPFHTRRKKIVLLLTFDFIFLFFYFRLMEPHPWLFKLIKSFMDLLKISKCGWESFIIIAVAFVYITNYDGHKISCKRKKERVFFFKRDQKSTHMSRPNYVFLFPLCLVVF